MIKIRCLNAKIKALIKRVYALEIKPKKVIWSHSIIFAEESSSVAANNQVWSFGNGATGKIGIKLKPGTELEGLSFQADSFSSTAKCVIECVDIQSGLTVLGTLAINGSTDGGGQTNNASKLVMFDPPIVLPDNVVLSFKTGAKSGTVADARVAAFIRHDKEEI